MWKSKVKRLQEQYECSKRQVEGAQFELERVKERNRKLEAMGRKKNLDERELLAARLEEMTAKVQDRDKQIVVSFLYCLQSTTWYWCMSVWCFHGSSVYLLLFYF